MINIDKELKSIIESKSGNKELALFYSPFGAQRFELHIGNLSKAVNLGESLGEFIFTGDTVEEVINQAREGIWK